MPFYSLARRRSGGLASQGRGEAGGVTCDALADRTKIHGFTETKASIANELARETVAAAFFLACLAALELEEVRSEELYSRSIFLASLPR